MGSEIAVKFSWLIARAAFLSAFAPLFSCVGVGRPLSPENRCLEQSRPLLRIPKGAYLKNACFSSDGEVAACEIAAPGNKSTVITALGRYTYDYVENLTFVGPLHTVAFIARRGKVAFVVHDGKEGKEYGRITSLRSSSKTPSFCYIAEKCEKRVLVVDGVEEDFDDPLEAFYLPDGALIKYGKEFIDIGGRRIRVDFERVRNPIFLRDGRICFEGRREGKSYQVIGDEVHEVGSSRVSVDPSGRRVGYIANSNRMSAVFVDGRKMAEFESVRDLSLSESGSAYACEVGDRLFMNGKLGERCYLEVEQPVLSSDGTHVAFAALTRRCMMCVVIDGEDQKEYRQVGDPVFDPSGRYVAYAAKSERGWGVVLQGVNGEEFHESDLYDNFNKIILHPWWSRDGKEIRFSADGMSVCFGVLNQDRLLWKVLPIRRCEGIETPDLKIQADAMSFPPPPSPSKKSRGFSGPVNAIVPAGDGTGDIYVGGEFTSYNGSAANRIIRLNSDGTVDGGFTVGTGFDSPDAVYAIAPAGDGTGDVYVGGCFAVYNGAPHTRIIRLNADGTVDTGFAVGKVGHIVCAIAPAGDSTGDIYVGGNKGISRLNSDGTVDAGFAIGTGFDGFVYAIMPAGDGTGDIYVGGVFTSYNGRVSNRIIRLNSDGTVDGGFNVGTGFDSPGETATNRRRWDGILKRDYPPLDFDRDFCRGSAVYTIAPASDGTGDLYVGGEFTSYNRLVSNRIIRLNSDGTVDETVVGGFKSGTGFDSCVYTIMPASNGTGDIYVGGSFATYNGAGSNRIIRLNSDGTVDEGFEVGMGFNSNSAVYAIAPAGDGVGDIHVGGSFRNYNTTTTYRIARLNIDGSPD